MLRPRILIPLILIVGVLALLIFRQAQAPEVAAVRARAGRVVEVVYATGSVRPDTETRVAPEVPGRLTALLVDEGDRVRVGQVLARLDDTDSRTRLREAETRLDTALARLRQNEAPTDPFTVRQIEAQYRAAGDRLRAAEARLAPAHERIATAERNARAFELAVATAQARVRTLRSGAKEVQAEIEAAREKVEVARQEAAQATAAVGQARASAESAADLYRRRAQLLKEGAIAERQVTEARTAREGAEAGVRAAESAARAAENRVTAAERAVATTRVGAETAQAQVEDAETGVETARSQAAVAASQVAEARAAVPELQRGVDAQRQDVLAVRNQLSQARRGQREVDIAVFRTQVRTEEAAVRQAREDLEKRIVRAPVPGRVTDRPVDPGDYVQVGARLFTVANEQRIYVQADVDEADIGQVRLGAESRFQVDARPQETYTGRVTRIGAAADRATKTYPVEIRGLNTVEGLRIGMTADVNITGRDTPNAILVPTTALTTETDHTIAWVVDAESRARRRRVRFKARDASTAQVVEGLAEGEVVVVAPGGGLHEGRRVKVRER